MNAAVRIGADDATGREDLARYLIRVPFSTNILRWMKTCKLQVFVEANPKAIDEVWGASGTAAAYARQIRGVA